MLRVASELTSVSIFALNLVTGLGLGLAIDYSLFIVSRYREEIARSRVAGARRCGGPWRPPGRTVLFSLADGGRRRSPRCWSSRSGSSTRWASAARWSR